jgi:hypothetical protein
MAVTHRPPSRFAVWSAGLKARLARSSRVFLIGIVIACGVEVAVDWNATLTDVNTLQGRMRERGISYVGVLGRASAGAIAARDATSLERLSDGLFDDEDVAFVRFTDPAGETVFERTSPEHDADFLAERGQLPLDYYAKLLHRDVTGLLTDLEGEKARMAASRYVDVAQRYADLLQSVSNKVSKPKPVSPLRAPVLYQDRLRTKDHTRDAATTYAFGVAELERGKPLGAVVVGFSMARTNAAIRAKYVKGWGMVLFFVGLIVFQNVVSRRDKLRLLELAARYDRAREALRQALPPATSGALLAAGALNQSEEFVDGILFATHASADRVEWLVLDPDGEGIDAAAVALHVHATFMARRAQGLSVSLEEEVAALGAAALGIPLTRPLGLLLLRVDATGAVTGLSGPVGGLRLVDGAAALPLALGPPQPAPPGVVGPLRRIEGQLAPRGVLVGICDGLEPQDVRRHVDVDAVAGFLTRTAARGPEHTLDAVADAVTWARGRSPALAGKDLLVFAITRGTPA